MTTTTSTRVLDDEAPALPERRKLLSIWLSDHLAATTLAVELCKRARRNNLGNALGEALRPLLEELRTERDEMRDLAGSLGVARPRTKMAAAWMAEKVSRLKLNGRLFSYSPLSRVDELEGLLLLAYERKIAWLSLARSGAPELEHRGVDVIARADVAERHRQILEGMVLEAAELAI